MTAPGWYNDAHDPTLARWHDGAGWTDHTLAKDAWQGPGSPPPPAAAAAPAGPPLGRAAEPNRWLEAPLPPAPPARRWERPSGHFIAALLSMIVIAGCLLALQRIDEDRAADAVAATTTTTLPSTSAEWQTVDGSRYRITVTPSSAPFAQASTNGCIGAPAAGTTNLTFVVLLENLSPSQQAPRPQVSFGVNVAGSGQLDPAITTLDGAATEVEVGPVAAGTSCSLARSIASGQGEPLAAASITEFTGVVGGIPSPVPDGLALIVRYFPADATQVARGTGFTKTDLVVPFPKAPAAADRS